MSKVMRRPKKATNRVGGYDQAHKVDPLKWNNGIELSYSVFQSIKHILTLLFNCVLKALSTTCTLSLVVF